MNEILIIAVLFFVVPTFIALLKMYIFAFFTFWNVLMKAWLYMFD